MGAGERTELLRTIFGMDRVKLQAQCAWRRTWAPFPPARRWAQGRRFVSERSKERRLGDGAEALGGESRHYKNCIPHIGRGAGIDSPGMDDRFGNSPSIAAAAIGKSVWRKQAGKVAIAPIAGT